MINYNDLDKIKSQHFHSTLWNNFITSSTSNFECADFLIEPHARQTFPCVSYMITSLIVSKTKFSIVIGSPHAYSQLSANGHSRKRTALLTDAFSNPRITSQSNFIFTHSRKRTLSRKRTRTLLEMKIGFFFCLRSL